MTSQPVKWLTLLGVGDDGIAGLTPPARALLDAAEIVVGSKRVFARGEPNAAERHTWSSPPDETLHKLAGWRGRNVVVLATGDPMHYGVGARLTAMFPMGEIACIPTPSAFSLACARLGWQGEDVETLSLHGRPSELVRSALQPGARIIALTAGTPTLHEVCDHLIADGFGAAKLTVLELMGGPEERVIELTPHEGRDADIAAFSTFAIDCTRCVDAPRRPAIPGLPDEAFTHDGQMTKREVRAATLAALSPSPRELLWDVGAGCGSVAIEWMRSSRGARAIAFERRPERLQMMAENASALGTPGLEMVAGDLPGTLDGQPEPQAVFLGGAVSDDAVFARCWEALPRHGRLVANAVTLEGERAVIERQGRLGGNLVRMDISHLTAVGAKRAMRPRMAVMQWRVTKP